MAKSAYQNFISSISNAKGKNGNVRVTSALGARSSRRQHGNNRSFIRKLKKEKNLQSILFIPTDIELPLDPEYGYPTELYNEDIPFRPECSVSSTLAGLKQYYANGFNFKDGEMKDAEGEDAKAIREAYFNLLDYLGVEKWDISDKDNVTLSDREVFRDYIIPRVYSFNIMKINSKTFGDFPVDYRAGFERDEDGVPYILVPSKDDDGNPKVDSETNKPILEKKTLDRKGALRQLDIANLYRKVYLQEFEDFKANNTNLSKDALGKKKMSILGQSPISNDRITNYVVCYKMECDDTGVVKDFDKVTQADIKRNLYWNKYTVKLDKAILDTVSKYNGKLNTAVDYLAVELKVGDEDTDMERGLNAQFEAMHVSISKADGYKAEDIASFNKNMRDFLDNFKNSENVMRAAICPNEINDDVIATLSDAIKNEIDFSLIESRLDEKTVDNYKDTINFIYGSSVLDKVLAIADSGKVGSVSEDVAKKTDIGAVLERKADGEASVAPFYVGKNKIDEVTTVEDEDE